MHYAGVENASTKNIHEIIDVTSDINFRLKFKNKTKENIISVGYDLKNIKGDVVFGSGGKFNCKIDELTELVCHIPANFLNDDMYQINVYFHTESMSILFSDPELLTFEIKDVKRESGFLRKVNGVIRPKLDWTVVDCQFVK